MITTNSVATPPATILRGYVIQHSAEYLFFADDVGNTTNDFDAAAVYGSRLAAHQRCAEYFKSRGIESFDDDGNEIEWKIVKRSSVQIKPKPLVAPFTLAITDPIEAIQRIYDLHNLYSERVDNWLRRAGVRAADIPRPAACKATITALKWAGIYCPTTHEIHYPIVYAMLQSDSSRDGIHLTVAHEVVHSYQRCFTGRGAGHNEDFYALMKHAAQEPITRHTHSYNTGEAKRLAKELLPWWKREARGVLASLPIEVAVAPMKRKGIVD